MLQTTREHNYKHGLHSYRLGIRKDKYNERKQHKAATRSLRVSPIKQKRTNTGQPKQKWGVSQSYRWATQKPSVEEMRERGRLNWQQKMSLGYYSGRQESITHDDEINFQAVRRSVLNRAPPEHVSEKVNVVNDRRADLSLRYKISQHLLTASLEEQNKILEALAHDPAFVKLYRKRGWRTYSSKS